MNSALPKMIFFHKKAESAEICSMIKFLFSGSYRWSFPVALIVFLSFVSCAGVQSSARVERPPRDNPRVPTRQPPVDIMGKGQVSGEHMIQFLILNNPHADKNFVQSLVFLYINEAAFEGVNHDIAFAQMCLETGFLRFGNLVTSDQNNFCGLGATGLPGPDGKPEKGIYFPDSRTGVRAHIQHLKAYATTEPLRGDLVNPRYRLVRLGSSPTIDGLAGTWAADRQYAEKIKTILQRLYDFSF
jgi:hypothetical protein